jgi:porin
MASKPGVAQSNALCIGLKALFLEVAVVSCACGSELSESQPAWTLAGTYTADLLRNTRGGLAPGNAYLDNLDISLAIDGEIAFAIPGLRLLATGLYNNAARFSERFPADAMTVSNIDAPRAVRLYEAWADWTFAENGSSVLIGLYDLNSEFDVGDARSLFINSSFGVGHELGQTGVNGPSIFPSTSLAVRMALKPARDWTLIAAAFDGVPGDPDAPAATRIHLGGEDGALLVMELQRAGTRLTKLAAGAWHYTEKFQRIDDALLGIESPRTAANSGAYALGDLTLWRDALNDDHRLESFIRIGVASDAVNEYASSAQLGFILGQPFGASLEESLGFGVASARIGAPYRRAQASIGAAIQNAETVLELTYRRAISSWLIVQPDIQFILDPGADRSLRNALVIGLRIELSIK